MRRVSRRWCNNRPLAVLFIPLKVLPATPVLGAVSAQALKILQDGGGFYRAQVGSFATSEQATTFCNSLKDAGGQCIVQKN